MLTNREQEVLGLLQDRMTNREIAARLGIGVRTVECHIAHIHRKLGVTTRREAATIAVRDGLLHRGPALVVHGRAKASLPNRPTA